MSDDDKKKASQKKQKEQKENFEQKAKNVEKKIDDAVSSTSKKIEEKIPQKTKDTMHHIAQKTDKIVDDLEDLAESVDEIAHNVFPEQEGTETTFSATYEENVSRLFILRFLWLLIEYWILIVWSTRISLISIVHFFIMLISGKRNRNLRERQVRFTRHILRWKFYMMGLTDKRPDFISK